MPGGRGLIWLLLLGSSLACADEVPDIRIGLVGTLTLDSPAGIAGQDVLQGVRLALDRVNAGGGVQIGRDRRPVRLVMADDRDRPADAATSVVRLVSQDGVVAVIGPIFSRNAVPAAEAAERVGVPLITPGAAHHRVTEGKAFVFRTVAPDHRLSFQICRFIRGELDLDRLAVLYNAADLYSNGIARAVRHEIVSHGGEVVASRKYTPDRDTDFAADFDSIRAAGAQAVFLPNTEVETVIHQIRQARASGFDGPLIIGGAWSAAAFSEPIDLPDVYLVSTWHPDHPSETTRAFVEGFRQRYESTPSSASAQGYDAAMLILDAIRSTGSVEAEALRAHLATPRMYDGASGQILFDGTGDPTRGLVVLRLEGGRPVYHLTIEP